MTWEIRGLTLYQPWAGLIAVGAKKVETRSWRTPYRGLLAIHAGKTRAPFDLEQILLDAAGLSPSTAPDVVQAKGAFVAIVNLTGCIPTERAVSTVAALGKVEREFGDYSPGRWAWLLTDVVALDPVIPTRGAMGLWSVPPMIEQELRARLTAGARR